LVGYSLGDGVRRNWLHVLTFASLFSLTLYVIIGMECRRVAATPVESSASEMDVVSSYLCQKPMKLRAHAVIDGTRRGTPWLRDVVDGALPSCV